ncbi:hypothetical protein MPRF_56590 [Mycolicibacterium parafortuitum]|uniref:Uncharacterized protein n=1 Tax=Mycolicibacterium parafortuitum TaxID=39692 RepID=A0A7I7UCE5_MYCPF|nr:hypothetical protein MPRF_56590 [Mycolicibacterium parafortuitum]
MVKGRTLARRTPIDVERQRGWTTPQSGVNGDHVWLLIARIPWFEFQDVADKLAALMPRAGERAY